MSLLIFQHEAHEPPAALATVLQSHGHRLHIVRLDRGDALPDDLDHVAGVIVMGGGMNVDQADRFPWMDKELELIRRAHESNVPVVGICLGAQLIAHALGGEVAAMDKPEMGWHSVQLAFPGTIDPLHNGIGWQTMQAHAHGCEVTKLPPGAAPLSGSAGCRTQAFRVGLTTYGFQYHFEWTRAELDTVAKDSLFARGDQTADEFLKRIDSHYASYRRIGDRLANNIALYLFPLEKR